MTFKDLQLSPLLLKALEEKGYITPSPIQQQAIPYALAGRDVLGCAQTGTGKTAAFALPIIQNLMKPSDKKHSKKVIRSLILTPTRELALQIAENLNEYGSHTQVRSAVIFGGVSANPQIKELRRGIDILVATPGRLNDLIGQGEISLSHVEIFVLDEADRMLDMGFIHDVKKILALLPAKKQTLFFSATMPAEIQALTEKLLKNPARVEVTPVSSTVDIIDGSLYYVDKENKRALLVHLLKREAITSTLVFTRTKHGADRVAKFLTKNKVNAAAIHGDKSQGARQKALNQFKSGEIQVLVSTTVVEVGVNVPNATVMMIENAERFGLAQLHQLRGRVGRGSHQSYCIMVNCSDQEGTQERLDILNRSNDGFYIASEDLKLRGPGDFFGIRQSGDMEFKLADIYTDAGLLKTVSEEVNRLLDENPALEGEEYAALKERMEASLSQNYERLNL